MLEQALHEQLTTAAETLIAIAASATLIPMAVNPRDLLEHALTKVNRWSGLLADRVLPYVRPLDEQDRMLQTHGS